MKSPLLICPSFFDQRMDGVGRVTGALATAMERIAGRAPRILSSNDPVDACAPGAGLCFARRYRKMLYTAASAPARLCGPDAAAPQSGAAGSELPVVCSHLGLSPVARILAARSGRPYVVFIHGVEAWKRLRFRQRWGLAGAARLLVNSHYTLSHFLAFNPWARAVTATVTPLGVPITGLEGGSQAACEPSGFPTILTVGRMSKEEYYESYRDPSDLYKGFKTVVEAVGLLRNMGVPAVLDLVGDGNARADLERWVATQPVAPFVNFCGRVSDAGLARHYSRAKVFVLASEGEGFGLVYAEAMAYGLPCVGVGAGATPEVVIDDESGYIVRARDSREIADRLFVLLSNPATYARLSVGAAMRHRKHYTQEAFIRRLVSALSEPGAGGPKSVS